jgi:hypothetical protein
VTEPASVTQSSADDGDEAALNAALAAASNNADRPLRLERGECAITVPMPPGLVDGLDELIVTVRLSADIVSFISPLATLTAPEVPADAATALLRRQFFSVQTDGVGFAIADREDVLVAQYHWIPIELTPDAFSTIFGRFVAATLRLRDEVTRMATMGAPFDVL